MPTTGEEARGKDIGRFGASERSLFVWVHCPMCQEERWTQKKSSGNNATRYCSQCAIDRAKHFTLNPENAAKEGRIK